VDGVLVRLLADKTGNPSVWFGRLFSAVLPDLNRLRWYAPWQPWMGPPAHFDEEGDLWRRGALARYWRSFAEEYIELWGFAAPPPTLQREGAVALLLYSDGTCWELYSDQPGVAERAFTSAKAVADVSVARARFDRRGEAFGFVGLGDYWRDTKRPERRRNG